MAIAGTVVHPMSGLSPIVGELIGTKISQMPAYAAAFRAAPLVGRKARNGTYVSDNTWRGLDLSAAPKATTPASVYATEYPSQGVAYATGSYEIARYIIDAQDVPDAIVEEWMEVAGFDPNSRVADLLAERVAAMHSRLAWSTLGATSGGFTAADPGNIAAANFDLLGLVETVRANLRKEQALAPGGAIDVFIADDVWAYIPKLDQVRARFGVGVNATNTILPPDAVESWWAAYLKGATAHRVDSYYKETTGTVTADLSGKILFVPRREGWNAPAVTIAPQGKSSVSVASVRSKYVEEMPGTRLFADGHMQIKILNATGAYLAHGLLT